MSTCLCNSPLRAGRLNWGALLAKALGAIGLALLASMPGLSAGLTAQQILRKARETYEPYRKSNSIRYEVSGAPVQHWARKEGGFMKSVMSLLLGLAALVPGVALATDLAPEQIVAKVSETYCGLASFRFVEEQASRNDPRFGSYTQPGPFGGGPAGFTTDLAVSTPGKIRLVVSSGQAKILLVSDGRKTWSYIPDLNEYTEMLKAPLLEELWANPIHFVTEDLARYRGLSRQKGRARLRGEEVLSLGGQEVRCYVVAVPSPAGSRTLWVDEQRFIVLRDEWVSPPGTGDLNDSGGVILDMGILTSRLTKADLGPISDDVFQFVVPSGARFASSAGAGPAQLAEQSLASSLIPSGTAASAAGSKAPDFTVGSLGRENVRLNQSRGKIVVLEFCASWCEPCQGELAAIQKLHDELAPKGVVFLGIDDESAETVKNFVAARGYTFPMLLDSNHTVHGLYDAHWAPNTVVIDRKGKIAARYVGAGGEAQLRRALKSAGLNTTP